MRYPAKVAYLGALSLFFSAVELFIPSILPFFRIGLANIPVIAALGLPASDFMMLLLIKAIGTSYVSGTLFSPFFLMSLVQTILAGSGMYFLRKISRSISVYSISAAGALISDISQIAVASIYAGRGAFPLLPVMLMLSLPASIITAAISKRIEISEIALGSDTGIKTRPLNIALFLLSAMALASIDGVTARIAAFAGCLIFQRAAGRRIRLLPHIMLSAFMMISSLLTPSGKVIARFLSFPITEGAIMDALMKSLLLSSSIALSQGFSRIITPGSGLIGQVLATFDALLESFHRQNGTFLERVQSTLASEMHEKVQKNRNNVPIFTSFGVSIFLIAIAILNYLFL